MTEPLDLIVERDGAEQRVRLGDGVVEIGRGIDCDLRLDDPLVSRHHCRLERLGEEWFVVDLGSANGTWLEGTRVDRSPFPPGATLQIGATVVRRPEGEDRIPALEHTRAAEASPEQQALDLLLAVGRSLEHEDRSERMAALLVDAAVTLTRAERGFVVLFRGDEIEYALGRNFARETVPAPASKLSRTLLQRALSSPGPLVLEDALTDGEFAGVQSIGDLGLRSLVAVPLRHGGEVLGVLVADHRLAPGAFGARERALLEGLAGLGASHLGRVAGREALRRLARRVRRLERELGKRVRGTAPEPGGAASGALGLLGVSPAMQRLFEQVEGVLHTEAPVLVRGESGTGKELVARALHFHGPRATGPFVVENCGALPDTLLESELFGHVRGAFTGATRDRQGRFEEADGGTLFLDEVSEMSEAMQARLLRVLQEGEIRRVGSNEVRKVDVRVVAATNVDLRERVAAGRFREDLFYRLRVVELVLPPLREREGDVALLARHFLEEAAAAEGRALRELTPEALAVLEAAPWPGNVRQLRNEMRRLVLLGEGPVTAAELSADVTGGEAPPAGAEAVIGDPRLPLPERVAALERAAIEDALRRAPGNRTQAARLLGITRFALQRKIEKYGIGGDPASPDAADDS